jgi:hypothetical protein
VSSNFSSRVIEMSENQKVSVVPDYDPAKLKEAEELLNNAVAAGRYEIVVKMIRWHQKKAVQATLLDIDAAVRSAIIAEHFASVDHCNALLAEDRWIFMKQ